jgi:hypothetical protein
VEVQYRLTRANTLMIAENRAHVIIKAGDLSAFLKERVVVVDLSPMSYVSTSMVILYSLPPDSKVYVEDSFENAIGFDLSSLLARMRRNLFT